jgi:hypothetical protein
MFYAQILKQIVIVTLKDVRLFNISNGYQETLLSKISNTDCELTTATLENNILIVGDIEGQLYQINLLK